MLKERRSHTWQVVAAKLAAHYGSMRHLSSPQDWWIRGLFSPTWTRPWILSTSFSDLLKVEHVRSRSFVNVYDMSCGWKYNGVWILLKIYCRVPQWNNFCNHLPKSCLCGMFLVHSVGLRDGTAVVLHWSVYPMHICQSAKQLFRVVCSYVWSSVVLENGGDCLVVAESADRADCRRSRSSSTRLYRRYAAIIVRQEVVLLQRLRDSTVQYFQRSFFPRDTRYYA